MIHPNRPTAFVVIFELCPFLDTNVIISSLTCLAATLSVRPEDSQIQAMLLANPKSLQRHLSIHQNDRSNIFKSWLVRYCFIEIDRDDAESVSGMLFVYIFNVGVVSWVKKQTSCLKNLCNGTLFKQAWQKNSISI